MKTDQWIKMREQIHSQPRMKPVTDMHYDQVIRRIYDAGANLATSEMADLAPAQAMWEIYGSGCDDEQRPEGIIRLYTHARSEMIEVFIDYTIRKWIGEQKGDVWLLPVFDDEEYVSWDFFFMVGTREEVIKKLKKLAPVTSLVQDPEEVESYRSLVSTRF